MLKQFFLLHLRLGRGTGELLRHEPTRRRFVTFDYHGGRYLEVMLTENSGQLTVFNRPHRLRLQPRRQLLTGSPFCKLKYWNLKSRRVFRLIKNG
jgi:hypothetical protein